MDKGEMPKAYEPGVYEDAIYAAWEESGLFDPGHISGDPYTIMMPPPNVTGILHLGHAFENALMDTMARFQRLRGKRVLLLTGTENLENRKWRIENRGKTAWRFNLKTLRISATN